MTQKERNKKRNYLFVPVEIETGPFFDEPPSCRKGPAVCVFLCVFLHLNKPSLLLVTSKFTANPGRCNYN